MRFLDDLLGGGLLPGTLTFVVGATGIGKTQIGLQYANAGLLQERRRGVIFDMSVRGDSQSQAEYARRMFDWTIEPIQYELFEYIYQQVLRKDPQWVARDLFRQDGRLGRALLVAKHRGSVCDEQIAPYEIDHHGLRLI